MIKPNEIRLGNWYNHKANWSYRNKEEIEYSFEWEDLDWVALSECKLELTDIQPIPLTPEVLEKCGFRESKKQPVHFINLGNPAKQLELLKSGEYFYPSIYQAAEVSSENDGTVYVNRIQYLHQLQNLIYALTGQELEYKP